MAFRPATNASFAAMFSGGTNPLTTKKPTATPAAVAGLPAYLGGGQNMTFPQAMPGQLEAIASQLSAGFGQPASAYMKQMEALYNPVHVPMSSAPKPAAPVAPKPTTPATGKPGISPVGGGYVPPWMRGDDYGVGGLGSQKPTAPMTDFASIFNQARTINRGGSR